MNTAEQFLDFKRQNNISVMLGVIGGSSETDLSDFKNFLQKSCAQALQAIGRFGIVCGGTKGGVPEIALDVSNDLSLASVGVYPKSNEKYVALDKIDFPIAVPNPPVGEISWGSETASLVGIADLFFLAPGGWGTLVEVATIMKRNTALLRKGKPVLEVAYTDNSHTFMEALIALNKITPSTDSVLVNVKIPKDLSNLIIQKKNQYGS